MLTSDRFEPRPAKTSAPAGPGHPSRIEEIGERLALLHWQHNELDDLSTGIASEDEDFSLSESRSSGEPPPSTHNPSAPRFGVTVHRSGSPATAKRSSGISIVSLLRGARSWGSAKLRSRAGWSFVASTWIHTHNEPRPG